MRVFFILLLWVSKSFVSLSQEVIATQGESLETATLKLDFTIGEPISETYSSGTTELTQGFHQTNLSVLNTSNLGNLVSQISIFPNPTTEDVTIINNSTDLIIAILYDVSGKLILTQNCSQKHTNLQVSNIAPGYYNLTLWKKNKLLQATKLCITN